MELKTNTKFYNKESFNIGCDIWKEFRAKEGGLEQSSDVQMPARGMLKLQIYRLVSLI